MQVIPVLDLKDGLVVHAVAGHRDRYAPIQSVLVDSPEPRAVLQALHALGYAEFYVADLNAIGGREGHNRLIAGLAAHAGVKLWVDAGCSTLEGVQTLLGLGVARVVLGTETLPDWQTLHRIVDAVPSDRLVISLDMRAGRVLSRDPELARLAPLDLLDRLAGEATRDVIVLDLARVGTGNGPDLELLAEAAKRFPRLHLIAGGGVRGPADLAALEEAGVSGALVATALHRGLLV